VAYAAVAAVAPSDSVVSLAVVVIVGEGGELALSVFKHDPVVIVHGSTRVQAAVGTVKNGATATSASRYIGTFRGIHGN
jgi:hypothetical protein